MWEKIDETSDRLRVKNGWIVRSYLKQAIHQVFVHDEFGTWNLNDKNDNEEPIFHDSMSYKFGDSF